MSKEIEVLFIKEKKGHFKLGQTKSVKAGYALNYLLPFDWAIRNTKGNKLKIDAIAKEETKIKAEMMKKAEELKPVLDKQTLTFTSKVHDEVKLYGSITVNDLVEKINTEFKTDLDKYDIQLPVSIKETGDYPVSILLHDDVPIQILVQVVAEEEKKSNKAKAGSTKGSDKKSSGSIKTYADEDAPSEQTTESSDKASDDMF